MLDTNVVVSAHLNPAGLERAVLNWALHQGFYASKPVLEEYETVLRRAKFKIDLGLVSSSLGLIRSRATLIAPRQIVSTATDPADNRFLECAEACHADLLITGNQRHFPRFTKAPAS